jgi:ubiquinone/menaquinone biosynthesis C-methylase UbiE
MVKFNPDYFPKYKQLSKIEKIFLRTCCYFPPKPRRLKTSETIINTEKHCETYEKAFGNDFWRLIEGKQVLDLGCGEGGYVLALAMRGAGKIIGLDPNFEFKLACQEINERKYNNAYFINGTTESLISNCFDVVISHDSFEHFEEPDRVFSEIVRITRFGGHILIKFGPTWMGPWGRHMSGTIRKDRPWIHLIMPEKCIMRVHSVYHDESILKEKYSQLHGGLNKMTVNRFKNMLRNRNDIEIVNFEIIPLFSKHFVLFPIINELFTSGVMAHLIKKQ